VGRSRDPKDIREAVLLMLGCGVFLVWAVTQLASVFFDQPVDPAVHGIMLAVVTGLFGGAYLVGRKNGGGGA
jgi:hypothetical protein